MLHEFASSPDALPVRYDVIRTEAEDKQARQQKLYDIVSQYMVIVPTDAPLNEQLQTEDHMLIERGGGEWLVAFAGRLQQAPETAYHELDKQLKELRLFALFREATITIDGQAQPLHLIHIIEGRVTNRTKLNIWLPLILFVATVFSVLYTGATIAIGEIGLENPQQATAMAENMLAEIWRGWPYALSILLILVPHEMGHYLMMRRYKTAASLPYFIPAFGLSIFGTFGAAIVMREPLRNRKVLFDVGAAGPLAGLVFAVPILLIGLATSPVVPIEGGMVEGNSILYALSKWLVFGQFLPNGDVDVLLNQFAWAGWTGLFVTALNLIPMGQLDGGHILYSTLGQRARKLYLPLIAIIVFMTFFVSNVWLLFALMLMLFGRFYAVPLDDITRLDKNRRALAIFTLLLFFFIITPQPLYVLAAPDSTGAAVQLGTMATAALIALRGRLRLLAR